MCKPRLKCSLGSLARLSYLLTTPNTYFCVAFCLSCRVYVNPNSMIENCTITSVKLDYKPQSINQSINHVYMLVRIMLLDDGYQVRCVICSGGQDEWALA